MLKAYIADPKWTDDLCPEGKIIIIEESKEKAKEILEKWSEEFLKKQREKWPELAGFKLEWGIEEKSLEKGIILFNTGIHWGATNSP